MNNKRAAVFGASGLTGKSLVTRLLNSDEYAQIIIFVRQKLPLTHPKLTQVINDFTHCDDLAERLYGVTCIFCCLGTTIKKAGSKESFKAIDLHLVDAIAKQAKKAGINHFMVISSIGARANASAFYSAVKGQMEQQLIALQLPRLTIIRPSLLIGKRNEFRLAETIGIKLTQVLSAMFIGPLAKYQPIAADDVGKAMYLLSVSSRNYDGQQALAAEVDIIENQQLHALVKASSLALSCR